MKKFGIMLMLAWLFLYGHVSAAPAQDSSMINTMKINSTYYVGTVPGFLQTIQSAVSFACSNISGVVNIPYDATPTDTIAAVTNGCSNVEIKDERDGLTQVWTWSGTDYTNQTGTQILSYLGGFCQTDGTNCPAAASVTKYTESFTSGALTVGQCGYPSFPIPNITSNSLFVGSGYSSNFSITFSYSPSYTIGPTTYPATVIAAVCNTSGAAQASQTISFIIGVM